MTFLEEVCADRQALAHVLKKHRGIRKIVEDLYPDRAHFIYELLQNAEDAGATEASFTLTENSVSFEHDGRPFTEADVWGITDIGEGTKDGEEDKIGRFGVGFKAVFAYSECPHIWSPTFSFMISELVLPGEIEVASDLGQKTRFWFPFDNPKKKPEDAYAEVEAGLNELAETTLLFLSNLKSIRWQIGQSGAGEVLRCQHSENYIEVLRDAGGTTTTSSHFLRFSEVVKGLEKQRVSIAFALDCLPNVREIDPKKPLAEQLKIVSASPARVAVFFPAEKEVSGLRFHLHAPFVPELSRASIKETPANEPLFEQLSELAAESLHRIRDLNLLTGEFLGVLPNSQELIPNRYQPIRSAIIREMNHRPLTPTNSKSYAPAKHLLQGKSALKELLSAKDLKFLLDDDDQPFDWAIGAPQKNSNADRFLTGLAITEWDITQFVEVLEQKANSGMWQTSDEEFVTWLAAKTAKWHQQLYALLSVDLDAAQEYSRNREIGRLEDLQIVRLSDGSYSVGGNCYFPSDGVEHDKVLPRVDKDVFSSGKSKTQQEASRRFLEAVGVREVGERDQVQAILDQHYTHEAKPPAPKKHFKDLKRFIALVEKDSESAAMFASYYIFERACDDWSIPDEVFLDSPYLETGLRTYYEVIGKDAPRAPLAMRYMESKIPVQKLTAFVEAVGVQTKLSVEKQSTNFHPLKDELHDGSANWNWRTAIDDDWTLPDLEKVLRTSSEPLSRLLWNTLKDADPKVLQARCRPNKQCETREAPSSLVLILQKKAWIPQKDGGFVRPIKASRKLLPKGFPYDEGYEWLKAIRFAEEEQKQSAEHKLKQATAKQLGFADAETLERAQKFAALPSADQKRLLAESQNRQKPELPEHEPRNPERREERVRKQAAEAPERLTEQRTRTVPIGLDEVNQDAGQYLREQYTNGSGQMICQVCKAELPFKLDDGTYYFEKKEFLSELPLRHRENYLALCPNHWAMFQHANGTRDEMKAMFEAMEDDHLELEVVLAQQDHTIYFTKTHRQDLLTVIEASRVVIPTASDS